MKRFLLFLFLFSFCLSAKTIYVSGDVSGNWDVDSVKITGNLTVPSGSQLTISPGVVVEFAGAYRINAYGPIQAVGQPNENGTIYFTIADTTGYSAPEDSTVCWRGIHFYEFESQDVAVEFEHCNFQYAKTNAINFHNAYENTSTNIANSYFDNCIFGNDGGILEFRSQSQLSVNNVSIHNTLSRAVHSYCAAILVSNYSNYTIKNSNIINNEGMGMYCYGGEVFVISNIVSGNSKAGVYVCGNTEVTVLHNIITGNGCKEDISGGLQLDCTNGEIVEGNYIEGNQSHFGGGVNLFKVESTRFVNNIIVNNDAKFGGGVAIMESWHNDFYNNTIAHNTADSLGGGMFLDYSSPMLVANNILYYNTANESPNQIRFGYGFGDEEFAVINCDIEEGILGIVNNYNDYFGGVFEDNIDSPPGFAPDGNYELSPASPCINMGLTDIEGHDLPDIDYAGNPRVYQGNVERIDIGAFEYQGEPLILPAPYFTPEPGPNPMDTEISILCDIEDVVIRYTIDGDEPNESSPIFTQPIVLEEPIQLRAAAYKEGYNRSMTVKEEFFIGIPVSGDVSGTWSEGNGVYCLMDDIVVPEGEVLTIEPGVSVASMKCYGITVNGRLDCLGTQSALIEFGPMDPILRWNGIMIYNTEGNEHSYFEYCTIDGVSNKRGGALFFADSPSAEVLHCMFQNNLTSGIRSENTDLMISGCTFSNNRAEYGGGIRIASSNADINQCRISDNAALGKGGGIFLSNCQGDVKITRNWILNNNSDIWSGGGIHIENHSNPMIINNLIANNSSGSGGGVFIYNNCEPTLFQNTIIYNHAYRGGGCWINDYCNLIGNIIYFNTADDEGQQLCVYYYNNGNRILNSDIEGGFDGIVGEGLNNMTYENNIDQDPLFSNNPNYIYSLAPESPCIDAGFPGYLPDDLPEFDLAGLERVVGDVVDIGAYEYQGGSNSPVNHSLAHKKVTQLNANFPNPFNPTTTISFDLAQEEEVTLSIYNVKGQLVTKLLNGETKESGSHTVAWNGKNDAEQAVGSGVYYYKLSAGKVEQIKKMVLMK